MGKRKQRKSQRRSGNGELFVPGSCTIPTRTSVWQWGEYGCIACYCWIELCFVSLEYSNSLDGIIWLIPGGKKRDIQMVSNGSFWNTKDRCLHHHTSLFLAMSNFTMMVKIVFPQEITQLLRQSRAILLNHVMACQRRAKHLFLHILGKHMKLSPEAEEVATFFAKMLDHEYTTKDIFRKNFFKDWRKVGK